MWDGTLQPGEILAGKYRIERVIGQGGMGVVVAVTHVDLHETMAIKLVLPEHVHEPEVVARFMREARAAVKIRNEHVARVSDVGRLDNGAPYMVMEYLQGEDLATAITRHAFDVPTAVGIVLQACEAVAEAHALGIVHRDLKPANLFLTRRPDGAPFVKVLDFGISKIVDPAMEQVSLTKTSTVMGSPLYMAPEQMSRTKDVDARADVWALGVILYETLARAGPFDGASMLEVAAKVVAEPHLPLAQRNPSVPAALSTVVDRCLAKSPDQRIPSVAALAAELAPFAPPDSAISLKRIAEVTGQAPRQPSFVALDEVVPAVPAPPAVTIGSWSAPPAQPLGRTLAIAGAITSGAAIAAVIFWFAVHRSTPTVTTAAPSQSTAQVMAPAPSVPALVVEDAGIVARPSATPPAPTLAPVPSTHATPTKPAIPSTKGNPFDSRK